MLNWNKAHLYKVPYSKLKCAVSQAQYVLIHTALIEYSQFGETEMSLSDFHSEVNTLRQKEGNELSLMEMEFQVGDFSFFLNPAFY